MSPVRAVGRRSVVAIIGPLAFLSTVSVAGTAAAPWLMGSPLLLIGLSPRLPFLILAAQHAALIPFLVVGTARLCVGDPFHYFAGHRLAGSDRLARSRIVGLAARRRLPVRRLAAAAVLIRPVGRHLTLAGAAGVSARVVVLLDLAGTVIYLVGLHAGTSGML